MAFAPLASGTGGLSFRVGAVPGGVGRIQITPFQLDTATIPAIAVAGQRWLPIVFGVAAATFNLITAQIPWAVYRVVGVVTSVRRHLAITDLIELRTLQTNNGANLLTQNNGSRIENFDVGQPSLVSLRDYPVVRAPQTMTSTIAFRSAFAAAGTAAGNNVIVMALLCDNLADDAFGAHLPGPYARKNALIRKPIGRI